MEQNDIKQLTDTIGVLSKYNDFASRALSGQIQRYINNNRSNNRFKPQVMGDAGILEGSNKPKDVIEKENRISLMDAKKKRDESIVQEVVTSVRKSRKNDTIINE